MSSHIDWRREIAARAKAVGVTLPDATIEEIAEHLDEIYTAALRSGANHADAQRRARMAIDESRFDVLRGRAVHAIAPSATPFVAAPATGRSLNVPGAIRLAIRQLRLRPGFALVTILVLALGIGASTTVFTVVDSVLLRPLPYADPDRLVTLWDSNPSRGLPQELLSPVSFMDYRALPEFESAAAWWRPSVNLVDPGLEPLRVNTIEVSGNLFDLLGVRPQMGQGFPIGGPFFVGNPPIVVISDRLWRTRYQSDRSVVGRQLRLNGQAYTVVGIMPPGFHYPDDVDVWQRLAWDLTQHSRFAHFMEAVVRLQQDTTLDQATAAVDSVRVRLAKEFPQSNGRWVPRLIPLLDQQLGYYRPALLVLIGAVGLVMIIGSLNVASLLLTRALSREREVAVRLAIGASPRQLIVQLLAEGFVLAIAGAVLGVLVSTIALPALVTLTAVNIPRLDDASLDVRALGVAAGIAMLTTILFCLVPAVVLLRRTMVVELRSGERGSSRAARRIYTGLVAGQVALACTLLVSSALLVRTVTRMMNTPTGVDADPVVTVSVQLSAPDGADYSPDAQWRTFADQHAAIVDQIRRESGIEAVGATSILPLDIGTRFPYVIDGDTPRRDDDRPTAQFHTVSDEYFESMRASLVMGRRFTAFDTYTSAPVVIVNKTLMNRYRDSGRPLLGRRLLTDVTTVGPRGRNLMVPFRAPRTIVAAGPVPFEVVGVVEDVRNAPLGQSVEPTVYFSAKQFPYREMFLTVRATDSRTGVRAIRRAVSAVTPLTPIGSVRTWGERMAAHTAEQRVLMTLLVVFGVAAGLLAALGVYGLFSWSVALRTRELAIRLTLGARPISVGVRVIRQSVVLIAAGLIVGLTIIWLAESALRRVLFDMSPRDPASLAAACGLLVAVALLACVPPALRALRVDPVDGLRAE